MSGNNSLISKKPNQLIYTPTLNFGTSSGDSSEVEDNVVLSFHNRNKPSHHGLQIIDHSNEFDKMGSVADEDENILSFAGNAVGSGTEGWGNMVSISGSFPISEVRYNGELFQRWPEEMLFISSKRIIKEEGNKKVNNLLASLKYNG